MAVFSLQFLFHLVAFGVSGFATYYDMMHIKLSHGGVFWKFIFLTVWNICFQTAYFGWCLICDLTEGRKQKSLVRSEYGTLQKWRDTFHACVAFPTTLFVASSFWILYAIDRELVFPKALDRIVPLWLNHLLHTTIVPFIITDKLLCHHHYPRRFKGLMGVAFVALLYLVLILMVAYLEDFWVYPILKVLSLPKRAAFISACLAMFAAFYILGELMTGFVWGGKFEPMKMGKRGKTKSYKGV